MRLFGDVTIRDSAVSSVSLRLAGVCLSVRQRVQARVGSASPRAWVTIDQQVPYCRRQIREVTHDSGRRPNPHQDACPLVPGHDRPNAWERHAVPRRRRRR